MTGKKVQKLYYFRNRSNSNRHMPPRQSGSLPVRIRLPYKKAAEELNLYH